MTTKQTNPKESNRTNPKESNRKQTNPKESNREQVLLLAGIPLEKAEAARDALAGIGITFSYDIRAEHHSTKEHLAAVFQAYDLHQIIAALNDYLALEVYDPPISNNQDHYDLGTTANLVAFLDSSVEWCGMESLRDAISFIEEENWKTFTMENPEITTDWEKW